MLLKDELESKFAVQKRVPSGHPGSTSSHPGGSSSHPKSSSSHPSSTSGQHPGSASEQRLAAVEAELDELHKAHAAILRAKQRRDELKRAERRRDEALEQEIRVERRSANAEEIRARSQGVRADFHPHHEKEVVGPNGAPMSCHLDGNRARAERWGVSPIWGGGHTQHKERARRIREEAEEAVEVIRDRQELYSKDNQEVRQATELYRRMTFGEHQSSGRASSSR